LNRSDWETRELFSFDDPFANADTIRSELLEEFKSRDLNVIDNLLRDSGVTYGVLGRTTDHERDTQRVLLDSEEFKEGVGAFLSKRKPNFRDLDQ
jgi:enoyl-CoA hydratase/carnithine racemase